MATKEDMLGRAKAEYEIWRENYDGDYQARFCYELAELEDRLSRLHAFIDGGFKGVTDVVRQQRLIKQLAYMEAYHKILVARYKDDQL